MFFFLFFFFKQKTAYEMRISDWSSDVCSSDLLRLGGLRGGEPDDLVHHVDRAAAADRVGLADADHPLPRRGHVAVGVAEPAGLLRLGCEHGEDRKSVV